MHKIIRTVTVAISVLAVFSGTNGRLAHADVPLNDPCSFVGGIEAKLKDETSFFSTLVGMYNKVHGFFGKEYLSDLTLDEKVVHFTRQPGFFYVLDCADSKKRTARAGMFGVGDVFLPLKKRQFSDRAGNPEDYLYGLTKFGLYAYMRKADLRPMDQSTAYLFNLTEEIVQFCTNGDNCDGKAKQILIRHHYATADPSALADADQKLRSSPGCVRVPVKVYVAKDPEYTQTPLNNSTVQYCDNANWNGLKSWTEKQAKTWFAQRAVRGQYFHQLSKPLSRKIPFILSRVACRDAVTTKKKHAYTLGGSLNAGVGFKVVEAAGEAKASISYELTDSATFEKDTQTIFPSYTIVPKDKNIQNVIAKFNDITAVHSCQQDAPMNGIQLFIQVDPQRQKVISPEFKELDKTVSSFGPSNKKWAPSTSGRLRGNSWRVWELQQYKRWIRTLWEPIEKDVGTVLPDGVDESTKHDFTFFYVAVFVAAAIEFRTAAELEQEMPKRDWRFR